MFTRPLLQMKLFLLSTFLLSGFQSSLGACKNLDRMPSLGQALAAS